MSRGYQHQIVGLNCGIFRIMLATVLAHGCDPCSTYFVRDSKALRLHLVKCFDKGLLSLRIVAPRNAMYIFHLYIVDSIFAYCYCIFHYHMYRYI